MRRAAFAWAMEQGRQHRLPVTARMLLVVLAVRADSEGSCSPSQDVLAEDTGLVERHIRRLIDSLVARGLIRTERRGRVLHYHIVRANGMDPQPQHRTQSPVSEPETPDTESAIKPDIESGIVQPVTTAPLLRPAPESAIQGQYRTPEPVFDAPPPPATRARVDSPSLEKKEEDSESPVVREGEEGSAEGRRGNQPAAAPPAGVAAPNGAATRGAHKLPKDWTPNAYSLSLGKELGFSPAEIQSEADAMRDWSLSVNKFRHDWDRQFNNWMRKAAKDRYIRRIRSGSEPSIAEQWQLKSFLTPVFDDDDQMPPGGRLQ